MISAGSPPDLVLDFTLSGRTSEAMKKISLNLGLPTVTSALGEQKKVWSWADLSLAQQGYLVQVSRVELSHWSRYVQILSSDWWTPYYAITTWLKAVYVAFLGGIFVA